MKKYFENPKQVRFMDYDGTTHTGIAYKNEIICVCCGGVYEIEDLLLRQPQDITVWDYWISFAYEIGE